MQDLQYRRNHSICWRGTWIKKPLCRGVSTAQGIFDLLCCLGLRDGRGDVQLSCHFQDQWGREYTFANYSYSISASISCVCIVHKTEYLVWLFHLFHLVQRFPDIFGDILLTISLIYQYEQDPNQSNPGFTSFIPSLFIIKIICICHLWVSLYFREHYICICFSTTTKTCSPLCIYCCLKLKEN